MEYEKINLPQTVAVAISKNLIELNQAEKDSSFLENNSNSLIRDVRTARIISKISKFVNLMPFGMEPEINPYFNTWLKNKNKTNK